MNYIIIILAYIEIIILFNLYKYLLYIFMNYLHKLLIFLLTNKQILDIYGYI